MDHVTTDIRPIDIIIIINFFDDGYESMVFLSVHLTLFPHH